MKNLVIIAGLALIFIGLVSFKTIFNDPAIPKVPPPQEASGFTVPDNIQSILDKSCLPCHGTDGKYKAKMKWNYDKMPQMKTSKKIGKLSKIATKIEKGKMPPKKFLSKNPDKQLTDQEKKTLIDWAREYASELAN
ncbi:MAG: heme-binding domain-containing protein [Chlorobi bacterium]|nr:heme-binding domain-containing protein [Chlorobiota bacterium]